MWSRIARLAALAAVLFACLLWFVYRSVTAPPSGQVTFAGIANFGQVDDRLYRGAQPELTAFAGLKALGVNTVVRLNGEGEKPEEAKLVESLGMRFVYLPWNSDALPSHEKVVTFLALLHDNPTTKVFVHCHAGADRTGVMVALYRLEFDHWTAAQAVAEMKQYHYYYLFLPHLERFVESFPATMNTDADFARLQLPVPAAPR
jgi:tyrosine-protein phosphatase SIW14